jgi:hypothetical protein
MRFQVKKRDARKLLQVGGVQDAVIDLDNGNSVGYVETEQGGWSGDTCLPTRRISLFDGKYCAASTTMKNVPHSPRA